MGIFLLSVAVTTLELPNITSNISQSTCGSPDCLKTTGKLELGFVWWCVVWLCVVLLSARLPRFLKAVEYLEGDSSVYGRFVDGV